MPVFLLINILFSFYFECIDNFYLCYSSLMNPNVFAWPLWLMLLFLTRKTKSKCFFFLLRMNTENKRWESECCLRFHIRFFHKYLCRFVLVFFCLSCGFILSPNIFLLKSKLRSFSHWNTTLSRLCLYVIHMNSAIKMCFSLVVVVSFFFFFWMLV